MAAPQTQTAETQGYSLDTGVVDQEVLTEPTTGKSMSKEAIRNRRKRANRRVRRSEALLMQAQKNVNMPCVLAVRDFDPFPFPVRVPITTDGYILIRKKNDPADQEVSVQKVPEVDQPKWLRSTAQLVWIESRQGKKHEFYHGDELSTHEKVHCVLNSIDNRYLSHDGCQRQVELEDWHDWEELCSPCKHVTQNAMKTYIHEVSFTGVNTQETSFYQTMDENLQYHTFTSAGIPIHAAQAFQWYESECNRRSKTLANFEALMEEKKAELVATHSITFGPNGNPNAETLSTLEYRGMVFRGIPRAIYCHVMIPDGTDGQGEMVWKHGYTRTMLAYQSFYRVMSTVDKEVYHYGGEHLFYTSGQPCVDLHGSLDPGIDTFEEFVFT